MKTNLDFIFSDLEKLEIDEDLFNYRINNIFIWKLLRNRLVNEIEVKHNLIQHKKRSTKPIGPIKRIFQLFLNSIYLYRNKNKKRLIVNSDRYFSSGNKSHEIYTYTYINSDSFVIDKNIYKNKRFNMISNIYSQDFIYFYLFNKKIINYDQLNQFYNKISELYIGDLSLKSLNTMSRKNLVKTLIQFMVKKKKFDRIFDLNSFNEVYLVCSYANHPVIASATERNITVFELQHGIVSDYHPGYSFPSKIDIPYLPNFLLIWNDFFASKKIKTHFNCIINEFNYQNQMLLTKGSVKKGKVITVISQPTLSADLLKLALRISEIFSYKVIFRLHPTEVSLKNIYENQLKYTNIQISDLTDDLYDQLLTSAICIGAYSTVIYESLVCSCFPIVFGELGYFHFSEYIKNNKMKYAQNIESIISIIKEYDDEKNSINNL